jgi:hypothetical protein
MLSRTKFALLLTGLLLFAIPALPQSCALCYTQILVLMVPPMFMSVGITWLAYRKRNDFRADEHDETAVEEIERDFDELE